jgi:hypothetical protein
MKLPSVLLKQAGLFLTIFLTLSPQLRAGEITYTDRISYTDRVKKDDAST